jgi:hypothetical protein
MSKIAIADMNTRDRQKAMAYDGMKQQAQAVSIFSAGNAQGVSDTRRDLEQALVARQQESQRVAAQEAAYRQTDQDTTAGFNYRDTGPSWREEIGASMGRFANNAGEQVSEFAGGVRDQVGSWARDGIDRMVQSDVSPKILRMAAESQAEQDEYNGRQAFKNMSPEEKRAMDLEYEQSMASINK